MVNSAYKTWFKRFLNQANLCNNSVWKSATYLYEPSCCSKCCLWLCREVTLVKTTGVFIHWVKYIRKRQMTCMGN